MLIDWFTVGAQTLNFLILVWLLKRFLYKPILDAIDTREKRIASSLADAKKQKTEAKLEREDFQNKNATFDQEQAKRLSELSADIEKNRQEQLAQTRQEADALRTQQQNALNTELTTLNNEITRRTQAEVLAITQKTLTDLASSSLEVQITEVLVQRLRQQNEDDKKAFATALKNTAEPVQLRSAFDLSPEQQAVIQQAINETFATNLPLQFAVNPDIICGIELSVTGWKVSWSIADYLTDLGESTRKLLQEQPPAPEHGENKNDVTTPPADPADKPQ